MRKGGRNMKYERSMREVPKKSKKNGKKNVTEREDSPSSTPLPFVTLPLNQARKSSSSRGDFRACDAFAKVSSQRHGCSAIKPCRDRALKYETAPRAHGSGGVA